MQQSAADISLKDKIHFAISDIEDEKLLESIYTLINYSTTQKEKINIEEKHLSILHDREAKYLSKEKKAFTSEEVETKIFTKYGF